MWYDNLDGNKFLISLYDTVPDLNDVRVEELSILREGYDIKLLFDMPRFADNVPQKWLKAGSNVVVVELLFGDIYNLKIHSKKLSLCRGDIKIFKDNDGKIIFVLRGSICCEFAAEFGMVKRVSSYIVKSDE